MRTEDTYSEKELLEAGRECAVKEGLSRYHVSILLQSAESGLKKKEEQYQNAVKAYDEALEDLEKRSEEVKHKTIGNRTSGKALREARDRARTAEKQCGISLRELNDAKRQVSRYRAAQIWYDSYGKADKNRDPEYDRETVQIRSKDELKELFDWIPDHDIISMSVMTQELSPLDGTGYEEFKYVYDMERDVDIIDNEWQKGDKQYRESVLTGDLLSDYDELKNMGCHGTYSDVEVVYKYKKLT